MQGDQPFFLYLAFNSPHFPLQAPPEDIARYRERYRDGWEAVRAGAMEADSRAGPRQTAGSRTWSARSGPPITSRKPSKLSGPTRSTVPSRGPRSPSTSGRFKPSKMEIHAAMVDRMDREIGRVLDQLRAMGAFENTLIFFLSDNGASAEIMVRDDGHDRHAPAGSAASHLCLGPGWSTVANTPFRRHKTWVHEGGIATPLIVHWPKGHRRPRRAPPRSRPRDRSRADDPGSRRSTVPRRDSAATHVRSCAARQEPGAGLRPRRRR